VSLQVPEQQGMCSLEEQWEPAVMQQRPSELHAGEVELVAQSESAMQPQVPSSR